MLKRKQRVTLGEVAGTPASETTLHTLTESNPFSSNFNPPVGDSTRDIVNYLLAQQRQCYHDDILSQFSFRICQHHAKLLLKKYPALEVKRGIALATIYCSTPYSFKKVRECCELWQKGSL